MVVEGNVDPLSTALNAHVALQGSFICDLEKSSHIQDGHCLITTSTSGEYCRKIHSLCRYWSSKPSLYDDDSNSLFG